MIQLYNGKPLESLEMKLKEHFYRHGKCLLHVFSENLFQFPMAAVRNFRKLSGLKQHKCVSLQFWRSEVKMGLTRLKSRCQQGRTPSENFRVDLFCIFLFALSRLEATCIPWLTVPSSTSNARSEAHSNLCSVITSLTLTLLPPSQKDLCADIGPTCITQDWLPCRDP